jgi:hypothetical protein
LYSNSIITPHLTMNTIGKTYVSSQEKNPHTYTSDKP